MANNEMMQNISEKNIPRESEVLADVKSARRHVLFWSAVILAYIFGDIQLNFVVENGVSSIKTPWGFPIGNIDKLKIEIGVLAIHCYFFIQFTFFLISYLYLKYNMQKLPLWFSHLKRLQNEFGKAQSHDVSRPLSDRTKQNASIIEATKNEEQAVSHSINITITKLVLMDIFSRDVIGLVLPFLIGLFANIRLFAKVFVG